MKPGTMQDVTKDIGPEDRERIDAIRREMVDAQRGHELASLRKAQGLTQAQVAKAMGVTQGRVSQIERGQQAPHSRAGVLTTAAAVAAPVPLSQRKGTGRRWAARTVAGPSLSRRWRVAVRGLAAASRQAAEPPSPKLVFCQAGSDTYPVQCVAADGVQQRRQPR